MADSSVHVDRNLALELVRVTEAAALAASRWMGRGDKNAADGAAVEAMRKAFDTVAISGTVVIGEGEMDEAPMLYIGEKVGIYAKAGGGPEVDIAVDPLEGTTITAKGGPNAMACVALAQKGGFLHAPDIYMDKLAVGPGLPAGVVNIDAGVEENLRELAKAKKRDISDLVVCLLDRDRHKEIVKRCRAAGARIMMIPDGDVAGVAAVSQPDTGVDIYMGSGGAPEGVLAAAALRCIGGQMQGRLLFENEEQVARGREMGVTDLVVCLLDRDRHKEIVKRCRAAGARIMMIPDGDVSGVVAVSQPDTGVDIYMGSGGAPEGVLAAAALRCIGGQMQGRLLFENEEQVARAKEMGVTDPNHVYTLDEMAKGDVMFAATGVTTGPMLRGVRHFGAGAVTHSIVMRSKSGTVRYVEGHHNFALKPSAFVA